MSGFLTNIARGAAIAHNQDEAFDLDGGHPVPSLLQKEIGEVQNFAYHGPPFQLSDLPAYLDAAKNLTTIGLDDRKFLLEKLLTLMSRLPEGSIFGIKLQQFVIGILYKDLPHPPSGYLSLPQSSSATTARVPNSSRARYAFRSADGSNYNPLFPTLGQAGTPYARSVPSVNATPLSALPDPGLLFDTLLRREKFVPHPAGVSSFFFALANLVIHSIFNTDHHDYTINNASSYLDLSVLYGSSEKDVDGVRRKDGTGRLFDDVFADSRVLFMPPSVCALLILLNRNHNYVAQKILDINERGTHVNPASVDEKKRIAQDDEIFSRARLVNSGFFMQIVLSDYVGAILGLSRDGLSWRLNPLQTIRELGHEFSPQGEGNACSIEFNLLYRWHATISEPDEKWTEDVYKHIFKGKNLNTLTVADFNQAARTALVPPKDVKQWTFFNLKRGEGGRFDDGQLADILMNATDTPAAAFQARGTPEALRIIEILSIEQSRSWNTCSLNEFRTFMGLKPYKNFQEWNPNPEIYGAAESLYADIDNLELHVGLQAEEAKSPMPGAGLCPGYTISRAILADAVCLTRGDRFFTVDFTPANLTSWGYQDCQVNKEDGSYGGMLTKLLFRTLPNHYTARSTYAHFPFIVPNKMKSNIAKLPHSPVHKYIWTRPVPPRATVKILTYENVRRVLTDDISFGSTYEQRIHNITGGATLNDRILITSQVFDIMFSKEKINAWKYAFHKITRSLITEKSIEHINSRAKYIDIVKDVINLVPVYWIANEVAGLEIKTEQHPNGLYRDQELYEAFADVCNYVFMNSDPTNDWTLHNHAHTTAQEVVRNLTGRLTRLSGSVQHVSHLPDSADGFLASRNNSDQFLKEILAVSSTHHPEQIATTIFTEVVPTAAAYSKAIAHVVDFYLDESRTGARADIVKLCHDRTPASEAKVMAYVREALRLNPPIPEVTRIALVNTSIGNVAIKADQQIIASVAAANLDRTVFVDPKIAMPNRPHVGFTGLGHQGLFFTPFFESTAPIVLETIFSLRYLKRAPGQSGHFNQFVQMSQHGVPEQLYVNLKGQVTPWPSSLVISYAP